MQPEFHIDYGPICSLYAQKQLTGSLYLAFRDVPRFLQKYSLINRKEGVKALDFGCGTGVSTRYLKSLECLFQNGLEVQGVDVSADMLHHARQADPKGIYHLLQHHHIPAPDDEFDLVFSTFVLVEFASKVAMQKTLEEVKRVMKKDGLFIVVTGSAEGYIRQNQFVSFNVDFPQNQHLESGDLARVDFLLNEQVMTFQNYYWTEKDYEEVFQKAGLRLCETLHPIGYKEEEKILSWRWKSELQISPFYIYVLTPSL